MKTLPILLLALAFSVLAGCNATTAPNGTTTTPGSMVATVNGKAWSSTVVPGISGGATGKFQSGALFIIGVSATDNTEISVEVYNPAVGSDSLGTSTDQGIYSKILGVADTTSYLSTPTLSNPFSGSVTITSYDTTKKTISGSFHFIGRLLNNPSDSMTVASGSFDQVGW